MSVRVMSAVWEHSQAAGNDRLVLLALADNARDDGEAWPSVNGLCAKTLLSRRTVQRSVQSLVEAGELAVKANAGPRGTNLYCVTVTPRQSDTPVNVTRDSVTPRQNDTASTTTGGASTTTQGVSPVTPEPSLTINEPSGKNSSSEIALVRQDIERICTHLADRVEGNGSKRPRITARWRDAARMLLDVDGRTEDQVHRAIDWCQNDSFWRPNVMSLPKLREKYDVLRLRAANPNGTAPGNPRTSITTQRAGESLAIADRLEANGL